MAKMTVLKYPDERLRKVAQPIDKVDDSIRSVIDDMFETMYEEQGVGLAATQVDVHKRLFVADCSEDQNEPLVFINPEITEAEGHFKNDEGCLSFPGVYAKVERAEKITVTALDKNGERFSRSAEGLLAICIQHEIDHLEGKLFVDYLSPLKRERIRKKLEKEQRLAEKYAAEAQ
ncbi:MULTISPECIES: peptide deformylase [Idiomarina]|jgi:peptide deformylase|uniref:Peptide deformylase n=1 Tax=Idiomarina abyssalis TaxID=86102 RepID=A0A8I1KJP3_9GAMM|nr:MULTISPECIES: peptide deformylase [Idiomarina]KPD21955.1 peptide deformylase [Idiomarina abyssalis]MAL83466.1 peptide deformylase [Idiomarina sp.]MAO69002.1 peptide deformylase [Idiomarina sp.]MBF80948.1 peptide deformylase [Idiomarina sp.]MBH93773.1 peptide deformylase [Idiomarina sp.]|tara:strand:+ start:2206 stop:2730 length:525 start_codon:yes stop_codon:yes gene_type:complete